MEPLAERMRPKSLDEIVGQQDLLEDGRALGKLIKSGHIPSMILWGPPGVGKTTLANIIANTLNRPFYKLSAINASVKDIREVLKRAKDGQFFHVGSPILFIDEIHRFSKSQQDSLLGAVEDGTVTLIGATTENPSFEVNGALLSRMQVYRLQSLKDDDIIKVVDSAIANDVELKKMDITVESYKALITLAGGDARKSLNILDMAIKYKSTEATDGKIILNDEDFVRIAHRNIPKYDKGGDNHYDTISAFIKSIRGSDPQASLYWLARMLEAGEDIKFIARRLVISAAEDIGLANPNALLIANQCATAVQFVGMPEARIILSNATIYLATSAKSNSAYLAIDKALDYVRKNDNPPVPVHLRNAPTKLMKELDYGKDYLYPHDYPMHYVDQDYMPEGLTKQVFYKPAGNTFERKLLHNILEMKEINRKNKAQKENLQEEE